MAHKEEGHERWERRYQEEKAKGTHNIFEKLHGEGVVRHAKSKALERKHGAIKKLYKTAIARGHSEEEVSEGAHRAFDRYPFGHKGY